MSEIVKFEPHHLRLLINEPANEHMKAFFSDQLIADLEKTDAVTFYYNGSVQVCGGISHYWPGRGQVWSVFSETSKRNFLPTYRAVKRWLKDRLDNHYERIELSVNCKFLIGKRRAEMLGFELEIERAKKYLNGEDCSVYSMVRA